MTEGSIEKLSITGVFTMLGVWLGHLAIPVYVLVGSSIIDYITGLNAAKYRGEKINSYKGIRGITKKITIWLLVGVGWLMDQLISYGVSQMGFENPLTCAVAIVIAVWLTVNEFISILENVQDIGIKLPSWLLPLIKNVRSKIDSQTPEGGKEAEKK